MEERFTKHDDDDLCTKHTRNTQTHLLTLCFWPEKTTYRRRLDIKLTFALWLEIYWIHFHCYNNDIFIWFHFVCVFMHKKTYSVPTWVTEKVAQSPHFLIENLLNKWYLCCPFPPLFYSFLQVHAFYSPAVHDWVDYTCKKGDNNSTTFFLTLSENLSWFLKWAFWNWCLIVCDCVILVMLLGVHLHEETQRLPLCLEQPKKQAGQ